MKTTEEAKRSTISCLDCAIRTVAAQMTEGEMSKRELMKWARALEELCGTAEVVEGWWKE